MTGTPLIALTDALCAAIQTATGKTVTRRYAPYKDAASTIAAGVWYALMRFETLTKTKRVDNSNLTVDLVYQRSLPPANSTQANPLENMEFIDGCMDEVASMISLFREGGALSEDIADNWTILNVTNDPAYMPGSLLQDQMFASQVRLEFRALQG